MDERDAVSRLRDGDIGGLEALVKDYQRPAFKPESTEGGRRVSILKWPEGALLNLG